MNAWFEFLRDRDPLNELPIVAPTLAVTPNERQVSSHPYLWVNDKAWRKAMLHNEWKVMW